MKRFLLEDPNKEVLTIEGEFVTLGRSEKNKIIVKDPAISRHHLNFYIQGNQLIVEDAGSQNGFLINGSYPGKHAGLQHGDELTFGQKSYRIWDADNADRSPKKASPMPNAFSSTGLFNVGSSTIGVPTAVNRRFVIYGVAAIALVAVLVSGNKEKAPIVEEAKGIDEVLKPLPTESYAKITPALKGPSEVLAESRFREALRDYYQGNYSRAIVGLQDSLALNPSNEESRSFLSRAEILLKTQLDEILTRSVNLYQDLHYKKAKSLGLEVLTILSEQTPGYVRKLAQDNEKIASQNNNLSHEDIMIQTDCNKTQYEKHCTKALDLIRRCRKMLGEENVLK
jgi:hypothetical protein